MNFFTRYWICLPIALTFLSTSISAQVKQIGNINEKQEDFSYLFPIIREMQAFNDKMDSEMEAAFIELGNALSQNMSEKENITKAKNLAVGMIKKIENSEKKFDENFIKYRSKIIEAFVCNENSRQVFLKAFDKSSRASNDVMKEFFQVSKEMVIIMNDMLDFLYAKLGTFIETDEGRSFENDEDLDTFYQFVHKLVEKGEQEEVISQKMERIQQSLFSMNEKYHILPEES